MNGVLTCRTVEQVRARAVTDNQGVGWANAAVEIYQQAAQLKAASASAAPTRRSSAPSAS